MNGSSPEWGRVQALDDEKFALAGELALGLLQGQERQDALHELNIDPEMRAAVRGWDEDFVACFFSAVPLEEAPAQQVWSRIEAELFALPPVPMWKRLLQEAKDPRNRGVVMALALAKLALLIWILYLFI